MKKDLPHPSQTNVVSRHYLGAKKKQFHLATIQVSDGYVWGWGKEGAIIPPLPNLKRIIS